MRAQEVARLGRGHLAGGVAGPGGGPGGVSGVGRCGGALLVPQQVQELSRDYIASPALASGTEGEREILTNELRREMANSILRRVDAVSRMAQEHPQAVPSAPAQDGGASTP